MNILDGLIALRIETREPDRFSDAHLSSVLEAIQNMPFKVKYYFLNISAGNLSLSQDSPVKIIDNTSSPIAAVSSGYLSMAKLNNMLDREAARVWARELKRGALLEMYGMLKYGWDGWGILRLYQETDRPEVKNIILYHIRSWAVDSSEPNVKAGSGWLLGMLSEKRHEGKISQPIGELCAKDALRENGIVSPGIMSELDLHTKEYVFSRFFYEPDKNMSQRFRGYGIYLAFQDKMRLTNTNFGNISSDTIFGTFGCAESMGIIGVQLNDKNLAESGFVLRQEQLFADNPIVAREYEADRCRLENHAELKKALFRLNAGGLKICIIAYRDDVERNKRYLVEYIERKLQPNNTRFIFLEYGSKAGALMDTAGAQEGCILLLRDGGYRSLLLTWEEAVQLSRGQRLTFLSYKDGVLSVHPNLTSSPVGSGSFDPGSSWEGQRNFTNVKEFLKGGSFVADISMEAFIHHLRRIPQRALASGGLGFLVGETMGNYSKTGQKVIGLIPLYEHYVDQDGKYIGIDWDNEKGVVPLYVAKDGKNKQLRINVNFNHDDYSVRVYQIFVNGTFILGIRQPEIFYGIYPPEPGKVRQMAFLARSFTELFKYIGTAPDIVRLNEPQLFFTLAAVENDISFFEGKRKKSIYKNTRFILTTHTPEAAALPVYSDVAWLKHHIGEDLVPDWSIRDGRLDLARRLAEHEKVKVIFAVSQEHDEVTKLAILPEFKDKTLGITNGSDPQIWKSPELTQLERKDYAVSGKQLFDIGQTVKERLNSFLLKETGSNFADISRPLAGLVRRFVEYKEQAILFPILAFITGDRDKKYPTPWGEDYGLGMNLLVGGVGRDDCGRQWVDTFKWLAQQPDLSGKFIFVSGSDVDLMQISTQSSDVWVSMPRSTREACGTSDNRAAFNGHLNIATKTGGAREYIITGVNGWLMDIFDNSAYSFQGIVYNFQLPDQYEDKIKIVNYYRTKATELLARYLQEASRLYYS
ncbi:MAG: hypothetical protein WC440_06945, partial [Candidatus Omnitrophota bacterium]